jgi:hypothetical protein
MVVKVLLISVAAALLGPFVGIAMFFVVFNDDLSRPTASFSVSDRQAQAVGELSQGEVIRTSAPPWPWLNSASIGVEARRPQAPTAQFLPDIATWQYVVSDPQGRILSAANRGKLRKAPKAATGGRQPASSDEPSLVSAEFATPIQVPFPVLQGRMTLGGP